MIRSLRQLRFKIKRNFDVLCWRTVFVPKKIPEKIRQRLVPKPAARCLSCASPTAPALRASATPSIGSSNASRRSRVRTSSISSTSSMGWSNRISWAWQGIPPASTRGFATSWTSSMAGSKSQRSNAPIDSRPLPLSIEKDGERSCTAILSQSSDVRRRSTSQSQRKI